VDESPHRRHWDAALDGPGRVPQIKEVVANFHALTGRWPILVRRSDLVQPVSRFKATA
jgi:hypothetical protein